MSSLMSSLRYTSNFAYLQNYDYFPVIIATNQICSSRILDGTSFLQEIGLVGRSFKPFPQTFLAISKLSFFLEHLLQTKVPSLLTKKKKFLNKSLGGFSKEKVGIGSSEVPSHYLHSKNLITCKMIPSHRRKNFVLKNLANLKEVSCV